jgi:hypothetical protein
MRRLPLLPLTLATLIVATPAALTAQSRPTLRNRNPRPSSWIFAAGYSEKWGELENGIVQTSRGAIVGGDDGGPHVALGAAWRVPASALELRAEALYNQLRGPERTILGTTSGQWARMASRDRAFSAGATLLWRALPEHAVGPYLMTGLGWYYTRLTSAPAFDDPQPLNVSGFAPGISYGMGIEAPLFGRSYFAEVRRHMTAGGVHGSSFVPLTIGTRF